MYIYLIQKSNITRNGELPALKTKLITQALKQAAD